MAHRFRLAAVALLLSSTNLVAQGAAQERESSWMAEFPPSDASVAFRLRQGFASKLADRLLRENPLGIETVQALVSANREEDALRTARLIFADHPERMARTLAALSTIVPQASGLVPGREERVQATLAQARTNLSRLQKADRAEAAYAIVRAESSLLRGNASNRGTYVANLKSIVSEYAGTPTALEVEVELTDLAFYESRADSIRRNDDMLAFARAQTGTIAGAKALYLVGFHVGNNADLLDLAPRGGGGDPTDRFLRVLDLVRELQSGRYPSCEWTEKGDSLITGLFAYRPSYSGENVDKLLAAYASFVVEHWKLDDQANPADYGIGYLATAKMAELYALKGDAIGGVERFLVDLEAKVPDRFAVRYLRAMHYLKSANVAAGAATNADLVDKAREILNSIHEQADGLYKRKAFATLASRAFYDRQWPKARQAFEQYVRECPDGAYAWVAALRVAQCQEQMGDWRAALASYRNVTSTGDAGPVALVLSDVFAARAHEAVGEFAKALALLRRAADRWDPSFGQTYDISSPHAPRPGEPIPMDFGADTRVDRAALEERAAELERTMAAPGAVSLERARWLLKMKRWQEAARAAAQAESEFPESPNAAEARFLNHCAQLEEALERADVEKPAANTSAAMAILDGLADEPFDFAVAVAKIARAYMASGSGSTPQGEKQLLDTLAKLCSAQPPVGTLSALQQDVADIRSLVFRPSGDAIFAGTRWNGFAWPQQPPPFVVTAPEVQVKLADGQLKRLSFVQRFRDVGNVLFVNSRQMEILNTLVTRLGGTKTREGRVFLDKGVMEAPNQPVGPSLSVMAFLNKGFRVIPGHWGGWIFDTFPRITEVIFSDTERTRALVRVTVGYAGGDVLLEKRDGAWRATKLTQTWVT